MAWLFDSSGFVTRAHCGTWPPSLLLAYQAANLLIALSYFAIPLTIMAFWHRRRQEVKKPWVLVLFASFIVACGLTHLADFAVFYWAGYRFYTALLVITAMLSVGTAIMLVPVVAWAIRLPSREYVHSLNNDLQVKILKIMEMRNQVDAKAARLEEKVLDLQKIIARRDRADVQETALQASYELLRDIRSRTES